MKSENVQKDIREEMNQEEAGFVEIQQEYVEEKAQEAAAAVENLIKDEMDEMDEMNATEELDAEESMDGADFQDEEEKADDHHTVYGYVPPRLRKEKRRRGILKYWNGKKFAKGILEGLILGLSILIVFLTPYLIWHGGVSHWNYEVNEYCVKVATATWMNGTTLLDGYDSLVVEASDRNTLEATANRGVAMAESVMEDSNLKLRMKLGSIQMDYDSKNPSTFIFKDHAELYLKTMTITFNGESYQVKYRVEIITLVLMTLVVLLVGLVLYYLLYLLVKKVLYGYKGE